MGSRELESVAARPAQTKKYVSFGELRTGARFYDPWTKTYYVKQDQHGAIESPTLTKGRTGRAPDVTDAACGFKDDERVVPIY